MPELRCLLVGAQRMPMMRRTLALGMLKASALSRPDLAGSVEIETLDLFEPTTDQVVAAVVSRAPDVIGFSCYLWNSREFFAAWPRIREALPDALIVAGGPDVGPRPRLILERHPAVDAVVSGEGERVFPRLLQAVADGRPFDGLAGVAFRAGAEIRSTPEDAPIPDLESLPSPYLSGAMALDETDQFVLFESSRGCPFDCKYCDWPAMRQKPREFSLDRMLEEMRWVLDRAPNVNALLLADADIFVDKHRAMELIERVLKLLDGTNIRLYLDFYAGRFDESLIPRLGSRNLIMNAGVQSTDAETLKTVHRFLHPQKIESVMRRFRSLRHQPAIAHQLIHGLPGDSLEATRKSLDWALSTLPDGVMTSAALVLPGADMGLHPERYDMVYMDEPPYQILETSRYSRADMGSAVGLSFVMIILARLQTARNSLYALAPFAGGERPYLRLFEEFVSALADAGLLTRPTEMDERVSNAGYAAAWTILNEDAKYAGMLSVLGSFVRERLERAGRLDLWGAFEDLWTKDASARRWLSLVRAAAPEVHEPLSRARAGAGSILWIGLERLAEESALLDGFEGQVRTVHLFHTRSSESPSCSRANHAVTVDAMKLGAPADAVIVSHAYSWLDPAERAKLVSRLGSAVVPGGRLLLWDDLLGTAPLATIGVSAEEAVAALAAAPPLTAQAVVSDFESAGWSLEEPVRLDGGLFRMSLARRRPEPVVAVKEDERTLRLPARD